MRLIRRARGRRRGKKLFNLSKRTRKRIAWAAGSGLVLFAVAGIGLAWVALGIPDTSGLWRSADGPAITVVDANGATLAARGNVHGSDLHLSQMSPYLPRAVLAAEDRRFYSHWGIDFRGVLRAAYNNAEAGRVVEGGSTISQQLAKNVFLTPERTFKRKLEEALLALWLEWRFTKDEILTLYLNRVYFGAGTYGVDSASRRYFDKSPAQLTLGEAALLAGLLKAPSRYAPTSDPQLSRMRANLVLDSMVEAKFITADERAKVKASPPRFAAGARSSGAQYFVDWVLETLPDLIGTPHGELVVQTTLHLPFQRTAERTVEKILVEHQATSGAGQAGLISIDRSGAVRAMVGGRAYSISQYNRAVQARRQPGSAFKPFVYLAAMEHGRTPNWRMRDMPITIKQWQPANFDGTYRGDVTLETALAESINTVAVRLTESIGRGSVIDVAHRAGISSPLSPVASLALGSQEVSLLELTGAYLPFATGGASEEVYAITRVSTRAGRVLYEHKTAPEQQTFAPRHIGAMNAMLRQVLIRGTGHAALLADCEAAGKTGTSQDFRDAWFIGYTTDLVTGVWVGNDDGTPMHRVTGGSLPAEIWRDYMHEACPVYARRPLPDGGYRSLDTMYAEAQTSRNAKDEPHILGFFERIGTILKGDGKPERKRSQR